MERNISRPNSLRRSDSLRTDGSRRVSSQGIGGLGALDLLFRTLDNERRAIDILRAGY